MMMARSLVVAVAVGLLLAVSVPSPAAKRTSDIKRVSDTKSAVQAAGSRGSAKSGSAIRPYDRRDDPYAPGVNWPGKW